MKRTSSTRHRDEFTGSPDEVASYLRALADGVAAGVVDVNVEGDRFCVSQRAHLEADIRQGKIRLEIDWPAPGE